MTVPMDMTRGSMDFESGPTNATSIHVFVVVVVVVVVVVAIERTQS